MTKYLFGKTQLQDGTGNLIREYKFLIKSVQKKGEILSSIVQFDKNLVGKTSSERIEKLSHTGAILYIQGPNAEPLATPITLIYQKEFYAGFKGTTNDVQGISTNLDFEIRDNKATFKMTAKKSNKIIMNVISNAIEITPDKYQAMIKKIKIE